MDDETSDAAVDFINRNAQAGAFLRLVQQHAHAPGRTSRPSVAALADLRPLPNTPTA